MLRAFVKTVFERSLLAAGAQRWGPGRRAGATLILAYHNVVPDDAPFGAAALHLAVSAFQRQLDEVQRTSEVVALDDVLRPNVGMRPRVAITFDDAYRGAIRLAVPELAARGLPATVFVAPGYVPDGSFWWDAVRTASGEPLSETARAFGLEQLGGRDAAVRDWARESGLLWRAVPPDARVASEVELGDALVRHAGLAFGSHTWSHPNLAALEEAALHAELERPQAWLRERFERVVPWLAYPYGLHSPAAAAAARRAGYRGALCVTGGHFRGAPADPFAVPRLNVPAGLSLRGFRLRLAGVLAR